jgi:Predicted transcriptional regulator
MPTIKHGSDGAPVTPNEEIGNRLKSFLEKQLGCKTIVAAAEKLNVPRSSLDRWTKGDWIGREGFTALAQHHCNLHWLLTGWGEERVPIHPDYFSNLDLAHDLVERERDEMRDLVNDAVESNAIDKPIVLTRILTNSWPVRGLAAADDSGGTRVPDTDDLDEPIIPPEGLTAIPVKGDSMSPVLLDGQYALIDAEREGFEVDGGIVVASIREPDYGDERSESMTGTFVKRCYKGDGIYYFTSINEYSPFDAWWDHCRIWPVIGIWFAGHGKPPKED